MRVSRHHRRYRVENEAVIIPLEYYYSSSPRFKRNGSIKLIYKESAVVLHVNVSRMDRRLDVPHALDGGISALHRLLEFSYLNAWG